MPSHHAHSCSEPARSTIGPLAGVGRPPGVPDSATVTEKGARERKPVSGNGAANFTPTDWRGALRRGSTTRPDTIEPISSCGGTVPVGAAVQASARAVIGSRGAAGAARGDTLDTPLQRSWPVRGRRAT